MKYNKFFLFIFFVCSLSGFLLALINNDLYKVDNFQKRNITDNNESNKTNNNDTTKNIEVNNESNKTSDNDTSKNNEDNYESNKTNDNDITKNNEYNNENNKTNYNDTSKNNEDNNENNKANNNDISKNNEDNENYIQKDNKTDNKEEMEKDSSIHVALIIDNRVIYQTLVFLTSLFENRNPTTIYDIIIMTCDNMNKGYISKINSLKDKYGDKFIKILFINIKNYFQGVINSSHIPIASYYRIELPSLLSKIDRVIYIDVEVLNFGDLTEMYNLELKNDIHLRGVLGGIEFLDELKSLGINSSKFFNSEIILMNLKSMRMNGVEYKTKNFINSHILENYQIAMNAICYNNWEILPLKYAILSFNEYEDLVKFYRNQDKRYMYNETELKQGFYEPTLTSLYGIC